MKNLTKIFFICITILFTSLPAAAKPDINPKVGAALFLQACGGDPQNYKYTPLNLNGRIVEAPNIIQELRKSPYGRPFTTLASSVIELPNGEKIYAQIDNFRDFKILDSSKNIILKRKVSGASSLYEYKWNNKTIAWGVGWHKYCKKSYNNTDFTVLRTYVPYKKGDSTYIDVEILRTNVSGFENIYNSANKPIVISKTDITNGGKPSWLYYSAIDLYEISNKNGLIFIENTAEEIEKEYNIEFSKISEMPSVLNFLSKDQRNLQFFKNFILENHKKLINYFVNDDYYYSFFSEKTGNIHNSYLEYEDEQLSAFISNLENDDITRLPRIDPRHFKTARTFNRWYEKNCKRQMEGLNTFSAIALTCFPYHLFYLHENNFIKGHR